MSEGDRSALAQPWWQAFRRAGGIGLALYVLRVWPAHINHFMLDIASDDAAGALSITFRV